MAQVLSVPAEAGSGERIPRGWWPVDVLIAGYLCATGLLMLAYWNRVPGASWRLAAHAGAVALIVAAVKAAPGGRPLHYFRHWYPLPYVAACYREMATLIPAIRGIDLDRQVAWLDRAIWGVQPAVWLERLAQPWLTEGLQIVYSLFVPAVLLVPVLLWRRRDYATFRYCAFLVALGFLVSYLGYFLAPVRGPRFFFPELQEVPLRGLWLFEPLQHALDRLESAHYDCLPSGHTELTLLAWWSGGWISRRLFLAFAGYSLAIVFATVYLRYHYTVDIFAGVAVAVALWLLAPRLYALKTGWGPAPVETAG